MQGEYRLDGSDVVLQKTPFSFDVSVWEFFWPLMTGAGLVISRPGGHRESAYLAKLIARQRVTTLHFVPSMLKMFLEEPAASECRDLRQVICSGEALPLETRNAFFERFDIELHNLYGPTEASVDVTSWPCRGAHEGRSVPIGRPISNMQLYVLDAQLQPLPVGVSGELYLAGVGLARGYLARPDLTAELFIPDPFGAHPGQRLYRTGDFVRYLPDGNIEFIGRADRQVKVRGHRIELGEIEAALLNHPAVRDCVVTARGDEGREQQLVAYIVARREGKMPVNEWRSHLKGRLPDYMIPNAFVLLDALPMTTSGKVQHKALPPPDRMRAGADDFVAPRTPLEVAMAGLWAEVLRLEKIGTLDNFFAMGGHSLLGMMLISRVSAAFQVELPLRTLFTSPTVAEFVVALVQALAEQCADEDVAEALEELYQLSDAEVGLLLEHSR
jgi:acyl-coenzyme A synthetase/AMP-(fatty) acid ligase